MTLSEKLTELSKTLPSTAVGQHGSGLSFQLRRDAGANLGGHVLEVGCPLLKGSLRAPFVATLTECIERCSEAQGHVTANRVT